MSQMPSSPRFLQVPEVAEILSTTPAQIYALVRRGELRALKLGGRGQWRVEASELEKYIEQAYREAEQFIREHPFAGAGASDEV